MSELDKTIEELEAEVQSELDEAAQDAPTKGAAKGESMDKVEGEVQDFTLYLIHWFTFSGAFSRHILSSLIELTLNFRF